MTLSGFQGLVFDLDGTLVDSMPLHLAAWEHTAREFGFHFDADWFYELGGMPSRKIALLVAQEQQIPLDPLEVTRCKTAHYVANLHKATVFPAMQALVERYHGVIPMGIGTGSPRVNAEAVLRNTGLDRYFSVVVTADDVELHKPNPDTFLLVASKLGVEPSGCL
ncbi:MAG: HAD family hydrolase, partial [Aeromonas veronii]